MNVSDFKGKCIGLGCDMRKEDAVASLVEKVFIQIKGVKKHNHHFWQVENDFGPISCAVHNIGANIGNISLLDTTTRVYTKVNKLLDR